MLNRSLIKWYMHAEEGTTKIRGNGGRTREGFRKEVLCELNLERKKRFPNEAMNKWCYAGLSRLGEENLNFHFLRLLLLLFLKQNQNS